MIEEWGEKIKKLEEKIEKIEQGSSKVQEKRNKRIESSFNDREVYRIEKLKMEQEKKRKDNIVQ